MREGESLPLTLTYLACLPLMVTDLNPIQPANHAPVIHPFHDLLLERHNLQQGCSLQGFVVFIRRVA